MSPAARKWIEVALTAAGGLLLVSLVRRIGLAVLWANISSFGSWFLVTGAIAGGWLWFQAAAWWFVQKRVCAGARLLPLWRAKIISDGFNLILPWAGMGGEAMRPFLAQAHVPLSQGIPAVVFDKTIDFAASVVFLAPVLLLGLLTISLPRAVTVAAVISLVTTVVAIGLLVAGLRNGLTGLLLGAAKVVPWYARRRPASAGSAARHRRELRTPPRGGSADDARPADAPRARASRGRPRGARRDGRPRRTGHLRRGALHLRRRHRRQYRVLPASRPVGRRGERPRPRGAKPRLPAGHRSEPGRAAQDPETAVRRPCARPVCGRQATAGARAEVNGIH